MGTATHKPGTNPTMPDITNPPAVHDPEHDIDARSATIWVVAGSVVLFIGLWVLLPIFLRVLAEEQARKIDQVPATERTDVMEAQKLFLNGGNPKKKSIDQVMKEMVQK